MADQIRCCHGPKCPSSARVDGKTIIVTGANTGIGKETARELALRGGKVIMACRNLTKAQEAADDIRESLQKSPNAGSVEVAKLDLNSLASVREFAKHINETEQRLDILINNAGIMACPYGRTEDGIEIQFGVNHIGPFLLTNLLLVKIKSSAPSRIVNVSSVGHQWGKVNFREIQATTEADYSTMRAYATSKLANVIFARELAKRLEGTGVTTYSLHPGAVNTDLQRHMGDSLNSVVAWLTKKVSNSFFKNPVEGSQTSIFCAVSEEVKDQSGLYYSDCAVAKPIKLAKDEGAALELWSVSCELTGITNSIQRPESK